jgi:ABC-2 type transport system permease protein
MWILIKQTILDRRNTLLAYLIASVLLLWMYLALFPSIQEQAQTLNQLVEAYPEALLKAFGIEEMRLDDLGNFLAAEQFSFVWPIIAIIMLGSLAGGALAGEIEKGSIELLLSQPVSRLRLFMSRYLAGILVLVAFSATSVLSVIPLKALYGVEYANRPFWVMTALCFFFGWAVLSVGFLFSAWASEKGRVFFGVGSVLVLMYVVNIVATLKDGLQEARYISFFYYFNPSKALVHAASVPGTFWVFGGVAVAATLLAAWRFQKRDIAV